MKTLDEQLETFVEKNMDNEQMQQIMDCFQVSNAIDITTVIRRNGFWDTEHWPDKNSQWIIAMFAPLVYIDYAFIVPNKETNNYFEWM